MSHASLHDSGVDRERGGTEAWPPVGGPRGPASDVTSSLKTNCKGFLEQHVGLVGVPDITCTNQ